MAEDREFEGRFWAVVGVGGRRYIGKVQSAAEHEPHPSSSVHEEHCPQYIELSEAYELTTFTQPVEVGPGQVALQRRTMLFPYDTCGHPAIVRLHPTELSWAEDFHENDRETYREMLRGVRAQMEQARVQKLGLAVPQPSLPPNLRGGPFGRS
jgi:hypothetical protein